VERSDENVVLWPHWWEKGWWKEFDVDRKEGSVTV
jgi:hypothetical protein